MKFRVLLLVLLALFAAVAETRLPRSLSEVRAFRRGHRCPSTGKRSGACPGYQVDHVVPLCAGGADHPGDMQWPSVDAHHAKTRVDVCACRYESHSTVLWFLQPPLNAAHL